MSSRGAKARNGHVTTDEYRMKTNDSYIYDAKILVGQHHEHSLPDYSHTPNSKYIKENPDGTFREMRIYDNTGQPILEIAYHPEESLTGDRHTRILHYHVYDSELNRDPGGVLSEKDHPDIYERYKKYLKEYGL